MVITQDKNPTHTLIGVFMNTGLQLQCNMIVDLEKNPAKSYIN